MSGKTVRIMALAALAVCLAVMMLQGGASGSSSQTTSDEPVTVSAQDAGIAAHGLEVPALTDPEHTLVSEEGRYTYLYSPDHRTSLWVAHVITKKEVSYTGTGRAEGFEPDPQVIEMGWPTARTGNYSGSGYDRGHLCPSADRNDDVTENTATFRLSNAAPQIHSLNEGSWNDLEKFVRGVAHRQDSVFIVTGPVFSDRPEKIRGGVSVPESFFKVVLTRSRGEWQAAGYVMPNTEGVSDFTDYVMSVDEVEAFTGFDFFPALDDAAESRVEAGVGSLFR